MIASQMLQTGSKVTAWVSEAPRGPNPMPVRPVMQRFDGSIDLAALMTGFDAVIDASHGFDAAMTRAGYAAAEAAEVPMIAFSRPAWDRGTYPLWQAATDARHAMALVAPGARVFSAAGWSSIDPMPPFKGARLFLRQTTPHSRCTPHEKVTLVFGTPPFDAAAEQALFTELNVDTLICRNLGGLPSRPKLDAATALGMRVLLINRPVAPQGLRRVDQIEEVITWIETLKR